MRFKLVTTNIQNERLDRVLLADSKALPELQKLTRSQIKNLIEGGKIEVNGEPCTKAGALVRPQSNVQIELEIKASHIEPSSRALDILFEDRFLLVINKPPGLAMHPGAGRKGDTLANAVAGKIQKDEFPEGMRPGIVHRLDMDTSGVVVVAKTVHVHAELSKQFAEKTTERKYRALVYSTPRARRKIMEAESGRVEGAIGRDPRHRKRFKVVERGGKKAATKWQILERMAYAALLELELETGRTHQIRVHMNHIGSPVIGDKLYGDFSGLPKGLLKSADEFGRQALHAGMLGFVHPENRKLLRFEAPLPEDFLALAETFRQWR